MTLHDIYYIVCYDLNISHTRPYSCPTPVKWAVSLRTDCPIANAIFDDIDKYTEVHYSVAQSC